MAIGLFGGTFNPIHNGHLAIILDVKQKFQLKSIVIFPSAVPPHKSTDNLAPAELRLTMIEKTIINLNGFRVSDIELKRKGPSFTIDTVQTFIKTINDELFLIMGSDAFLEIHTWKDKDKLFEIIPIIVMFRGNKINKHLFTAYIDENISKGYKSKKLKFIHDRKQDIHICNVPMIDISSTMIRTRIKNGLSTKELIPHDVAEIIREKDLYK